jgi:proton-dependent oligopeptide transporter, POT family
LKILNETQNLQFMSDSVSSTTTTVAVTQANGKYRTLPDQHLTTMPSSVPYIIGNEAAERFSFYGMRGILTVFMTTYLMNNSGQLAVMSDNEANGWFHAFVGAVYFLPFVGGILADGFLGKYRTIMWLSIVYCLGHFTLALNDTRLGLFLGLMLIAIGSGGIKPCVSANVGDQFGRGNNHLLTKVFGWFYLSINLGSTFSSWFCPVFLNTPGLGPRVAFGVPGIFMVIATIVFWMGRKKMVHVPPGGWQFVRETFSGEGLSAIARLTLIYVFVAVFWALWDQSSGGEWTLQARDLDRSIFGWSPYAEQIQIINPILILTFIPLFNYVVYPAVNRFFTLTPLRKIGIGLFFTAASFIPIWWLAAQIDAGLKPSVLWQVPAYILLTAGEVMVSVTALEFSYTQAPKTMKSAIMAIFLLSVWLGNIFDSVMHLVFIPALKGAGVNLDGANFFAFFTILMFVAALAFIFFSRFYRGKTYIQGAEEEELATTETLSS